MSDIIYLTDVSTITCVVDKGRSDAVLLAARDVGARGAIVHSVRGWGTRERLGALGVAVETEKDVVTFLVSSDQPALFASPFSCSGEPNFFLCNRPERRSSPRPPMSGHSLGGLHPVRRRRGPLESFLVSTFPLYPTVRPLYRRHKPADHGWSFSPNSPVDPLFRAFLANVSRYLP